MALINPVVLPSKAIKGGKNKVRIAVAHNGETRYIVTDIILDSSKEFKNGMVVKRPDANMLNAKIRKLLQRYQSALDDIEYTDGLTCPELLFLIKEAGYNKNRSLKSIFEEYIANSSAKPESLSTYKIWWANIAACFGGQTGLRTITHSHVIKFDKYLRAKKLSPTTIRSNIVFFKCLLTYAVRCGYVQFRIDPFLGYRAPKAQVRQSWLSVEEVRRVRDVVTKKKNLILCRDLFMLSYYLGGINIVDLIKINFDEQRDVLHYVRTKTETRQKINEFVEFEIPEEAKEIIARLKGKNGYLGLSKYKIENRCNHYFKENMPKLAALVGIKKLIYYSARKSFSQHAYNLGVKESVIDYILGHQLQQGRSSIFAYIFVTPEMATEAVRKVLDNLK